MALRRRPSTRRVTPFLWYDGQAEEAARFYVSVFGKGSRVKSASPMSVTFELEGQPFIALNGGPMFRFTEAVSLFVDCKEEAMLTMGKLDVKALEAAYRGEVGAGRAGRAAGRARSGDRRPLPRADAKCQVEGLDPASRPASRSPCMRGPGSISRLLHPRARRGMLPWA